MQRKRTVNPNSEHICVALFKTQSGQGFIQLSKQKYTKWRKHVELAHELKSPVLNYSYKIKYMNHLILPSPAITARVHVLAARIHPTVAFS